MFGEKGAEGQQETVNAEKVAVEQNGRTVWHRQPSFSLVEGIRGMLSNLNAEWLLHSS
jgi:hypothetical protein